MTVQGWSPHSLPVEQWPKLTLRFRRPTYPRRGGVSHFQLLVLCVIGLCGLIYSWRDMAVSRSAMSNMTTPGRNGTKGMVYPVPNVALLGQFNYDVPKHQIQSWITIWSKYFTTISVVGPFSNATYHSLRRQGVDIYLGDNDRGYYSPVKNVVEALQRAPTGIDALLYVHDDGLLNLTRFTRGRSKFPTHRFMGNLQHIPDLTYSITVPPNQYGEIVYDIPGHEKTPTTNRDLFLQSMHPWYFNQVCLDQHIKMVTRPNSNVKDFATKTLNDGSFYFFAAKGQQDFLLVPMIHKDLFIRIAQFFIESEVFLECAFPSIILWLFQEEQRRKNVTKKEYFASSALMKKEAVQIPLCTSWEAQGPYARGSVGMLENCFNKSHAYGLYHPIKLSVHGAEDYANWLNRIQRPIPPL